jgi:DNA polymerase gamma 1
MLKYVSRPWTQLVSGNGLKDCAKLYLDELVDKSSRDVFVEGNMQDVVTQFQELMDYCASDVDVTYRLFSDLFPRYMAKWFILYSN